MGRVVKNSLLISFLTLMSRILGVFRDALIAFVFGTTAVTDAFFVAFRPFDLARKMFSEGILSMAFIPVFSSTLNKQGHSKAIGFVFSFLTFFSVVSVLLILCGIWFAPQIISFIAPGYTMGTAEAGLTVFLFRIMLPYIWCMSIVALGMGALHTCGNFLAPALAPVILNLTIIFFTFFICNRLDMPIKGLAYGVTTGGMLQLAVQVHFMVRHGLLTFRLHHFFVPEILVVIKTMIPCMIGAASYQINIVIASFFASMLPDGSVSYLYFADRLVQFPLALFAVSVSTVFLPELSNTKNSGSFDTVADLFSKGVRLVFFIIIPAMAGLMALNTEIIMLLFGQGRFGAAAISQTAECLFYIVTGLWACAGVRMFVTLFYAVNCIRIPFYCGVVSIMINFGGCFFLIDLLGLKGLAISVSLASMISFIILFFNIPAQAGIKQKTMMVSACRSLFSSGIMYLFVEQVSKVMIVHTTGKLMLGIGVAGTILSAVLFYTCMSAIVSNSDVMLIKKAMLEKYFDKK
jgi:putative peptidoglycan lipid II flippase